jgi:hypothetical protein
MSRPLSGPILAPEEDLLHEHGEDRVNLLAGSGRIEIVQLGDLVLGQVLQIQLWIRGH